MATAEARVRSLCDVLKQGVIFIGKEIDRKERQVRSLEARLAELQGQPKADQAEIRRLREELAALQNELETDRAQLSAFQDEVSASCN